VLTYNVYDCSDFQGLQNMEVHAA